MKRNTRNRIATGALLASLSFAGCATDTAEHNSEVHAVTTDGRNGAILVGSYHTEDGALVLTQEFVDMALEEDVTFSLAEATLTPAPVVYAVGLTAGDEINITNTHETIGALHIADWDFVYELDEERAGTLFPEEDDWPEWCD